MYFTHSLAGAIVTKPLIDRVESKFTEKEKTVLWFVGITASVLPDFDITYSVLNHLSNHRDFITHGIFIYLIIALIIYSLSFLQDKKEFGRKFFKTLSLIFSAGIASHLFIDTLAGGISLLAPLTYRVIGFGMLVKRGNGNWLTAYLKSWYMLVETLMVTSFGFIMKGKKYFTARIFALFYVLAALFAFVSISVVFF